MALPSISETRTNGRVVSVCLSDLSVVVCLSLSDASYSKSYHWQSTVSRIWGIDWYQNEWPWPMHRGHWRSWQPFHHIRHWISWKPLETEAWFQRTVNTKWPMGNRIVTWVTWPMTSQDIERSMSLVATPICLKPNISKKRWRCYLATIANY